MVGDALRGFQGGLVLQVRGDAGRSEGVVPDSRLNAGATHLSVNHPVGVLLPDGRAGELACLAGLRAEYRLIRISGDAGRGTRYCSRLW